MEIATTEQPRLTGLEVAETKPELKPEHWIERGPSKRLMLFSGRSHPALAQRIAEKLGIQVGDVSLRTFAAARRTAATRSRSAVPTSSSSRRARRRSTST